MANDNALKQAIYEGADQIRDKLREAARVASRHPQGGKTSALQAFAMAEALMRRATEQIHELEDLILEKEQSLDLPYVDPVESVCLSQGVIPQSVVDNVAASYKKPGPKPQKHR